MKIRSITLKNFRQFYGEHHLELSVKEDKNITVIHGENGGGKTSILNAFKWVLYEDTDLDTGDKKLLNTRAFTECDEGEEVELSVVLKFEHEEKEYEAIRTQTFRKAGDEQQKIGSAELSLSYLDVIDGYQNDRGNPEVSVKRILPKNLHSYFFFHGENIQNLASVQGSNNVKDAIKNLMGIEIVERACKHLDGGVKSALRAEKKKFASGKDAEILEEIEKLEKKINDCKKENEDHEKNILEANKEIKIIDEKLGDYKQVEKYRNDRLEKQEHISNYKEDIKIFNEQNHAMINARGFQAFMKGSASIVSEELEARRKKGELPYKIKRQFIDDLLSNNKCICGSDLSDGTDYHKHISDFAEKVETADLEEGFMITTSALNNFSEEAEKLKEDLTNNVKAINEKKRKIKKLEEELDQISEKIDSAGVEEVSKLEARRKELTDIDKSCDRKIYNNNEQIKSWSEKVKELDKQYKEEASKSESARLVEKQIELAEAAKDGLSNIISSLSNDIRKNLSEKVKHTVDQILRNEYMAEIDENYSLKFYQHTPRGKSEVPELSSGQKAASALSFIASVINIAKQRFNSSGKHDYFTGGLYPLVMDTPFGNADEDHSVKIARYIPELSDQVIILVSNKNWSEEVDDICRSKIGKEYSLIHYTPNPKENVDSNYERESATGYEYSEFEEGYYGRQGQTAIAV